MNSLRVALVEDNAIFCFLFKKFLENYSRRKIDVVILNNGQDALDYFINHKDDKAFEIDMLFIDINMPLLNGWELIEGMLERGITYLQEIPVYIVTSSKSDLDRAKSLEYSFIKEYIIKPIDKDQIYKLIDDLVDHGNSHEEELS